MAEKIKIGFLPNNILDYNNCLASQRLRIHDVIDFFKNDKIYSLGLYNNNIKYDIVVFQKFFDSRALSEVDRIKSKKTKIVLDINVNYYETKSSYILKKQKNDIHKFTSLCDGIITTSKHIEDAVFTFFNKKYIKTICESIHDKYFNITKKQKDIKTFVWSGLSQKADCFHLIKDPLLDIYKDKKFELLVISEKNPRIKIGKIPIKYIKYNEDEITNLLVDGDVFIAPRDLSDYYNLGHSFTKIGVAMAAGIPCIASPVPSYLGSPAIICQNDNEWREELHSLLTKKTNTQKLSKDGINYCKQGFSKEKIKKCYKTFFNTLMSL